ncbi:hypothetical protein ACIRST_03085 [Kitasatospora sp. NPDC101447]|uniref:hypothetical protein n=1 Tax=Kitasatospora sp. NPDC101447 TaxID=3364102 RepID=UPI003801CEF4
MPGTRHLGSGRTGRTARWLAAALLVPALAACGGGGGDSASGQRSDSGQSGAGQSGNGQTDDGRTDDQRTQDTGNQGGFRTAGEPSANVQGSDNTALITLHFTSSTSFDATVSKVADCGSSAYAVNPGSQQVKVTDGVGEQVEFTLPNGKPGTKERTICLTVTVGGSSKRITAAGSVQNTSPDQGTTTSPGGKTPDGGVSPYGGTSSGAGSNS